MLTVLKRGFISGLIFGTVSGALEGSLYLLREPLARPSYVIYLSCSAVYYALIFCVIGLTLSIVYYFLFGRETAYQKLIPGILSFNLLFVVVLYILYRNDWFAGWSSSFESSDILIGMLCISGIVLAHKILFIVWNQIVRVFNGMVEERGKRYLLRALYAFSGIVFLCFISLNIPSLFARSSGGDRPNVILLVLDTLRADHVSSYGYTRETTPNLDKVASEGVIFENAITQYPASLGSHASLFTSLYPGAHCTYLHIADSNLNPSFVTLAEKMKAEGYKTIAILDNPWVSTRSGLSQGFDTFINRDKMESLALEDFFMIRDRLLLFRCYYSLADQRNLTTRLGEHWLSGFSRNQPFFLFLHYITIHTPYTPPPSYVDRLGKLETGHALDRNSQIFLQGLVGGKEIVISDNLTQDLTLLYDASIAYTDNEVAQVLRCLEESGRGESTLLVVTADHGESLNQHVRILYEHGDLYDSGLRVPLIFHYGRWGYARRRIEQPVELIDIYPTILEIAGIQDYNDGVNGRSLFPAIRGEEGPADTITFSQVGLNSFAVRTPNWKYIDRNQGTVQELYDLKGDPGERMNLAMADPQRTNRLSDELHRWRSSLSCLHEGAQDPGNFDEELERELKALGYLQ